jgi:hypothetical protein
MESVIAYGAPNVGLLLLKNLPQWINFAFVSSLGTDETMCAMGLGDVFITIAYLFCFKNKPICLVPAVVLLLAVE